MTNWCSHLFFFFLDLCDTEQVTNRSVVTPRLLMTALRKANKLISGSIYFDMEQKKASAFVP